jgi:hypothetical protein
MGRREELDVVVGNSLLSSVTVARVLCDGNVLGTISTPVGPVPVDVAVGDVDGDGVADVVTANRATDGDDHP